MIPNSTGGFGIFDYTGDTLRHTYQNGFGFYFQDAYHVTPRVVLNYGLRWDYYGVVAERNHLFSDFIPSHRPPASRSAVRAGLTVFTIRTRKTSRPASASCGT